MAGWRNGEDEKLMAGIRGSNRKGFIICIHHDKVGRSKLLNFSSHKFIENRIYREEFTGKKCKTAILLYCFHTAGVLHIFMLYNLLGPGISFIENLKLLLKETHIMK